MSSLLRCVFRTCFCLGKPEEEERNNSDRGSRRRRSSRGSRSSRQPQPAQYQLAATNSNDAEDNDNEANAVERRNSSSSSSSRSRSRGEGNDSPAPPSSAPAVASSRRRQSSSGEEEKEEERVLLEESAAAPAAPNSSSRLGDFWNRVRTRMHQFEDRAVVNKPVRSATHEETDDEDNSDSATPLAPLLKEATTFQLGHKDGNDSASALIPTIASDQVVVPGSDLQRAMATKAREDCAICNQTDECVICMEGFDETNPRMPTLCGCGQNKTYFHLPCLYQWIEQSRNCPACRKKLRWEEF